MTAVENVHGRPARAHEGRAVRLDLPPAAACAARSARSREKAREMLELRRACAQRHHDQLAINLSYGDQRRVEIARALASDPQAAAARRADGGHEPAGVRPS